MLSFLSLGKVWGRNFGEKEDQGSKESVKWREKEGSNKSGRSGILNKR